MSQFVFKGNLSSAASLPPLNHQKTKMEKCSQAKPCQSLDHFDKCLFSDIIGFFQHLGSGHFRPVVFSLTVFPFFASFHCRTKVTEYILSLGRNRVVDVRQDVFLVLSTCVVSTMVHELRSGRPSSAHLCFHVK